MSEANQYAKPADETPIGKCPVCKRGDLQKNTKTKSHTYKRVTCDSCDYGYIRGLA